MNLLKIRLISGMVGYALVAGAIVAAVLNHLQHMISWSSFFAIILFFLFVEVVNIQLVSAGSQKKDKKKLINIYMLTKVIKVVLSLFFVLFYVILNKGSDLKTFIIVFVVFYILFLLAELFAFSRIEKHIKANENNE
ncbi:hypothetical protein D0T66_04855 [Dysgonomonas sp. 25]|nr:hypothetical protein [Dysgonomonas sp. 25]